MSLLTVIPAIKTDLNKEVKLVVMFSSNFMKYERVFICKQQCHVTDMHVFVGVTR